jgi:threonine/homoserine/homoserine lactone efflux protein
MNRKTAAFFLAFIPQFVDPSLSVAMQFVLFGLICVVLNTAADVVVVYWVAKARSRLTHPDLIKRVRQTSGIAMCGLGASLLLARRSS